MRAVVVPYQPAGHGVQAVCACLSASYCPALHGSHRVAADDVTTLYAAPVRCVMYPSPHARQLVVDAALLLLPS